MSGAYEEFVRPLLFQLDPERAHHLALAVLRDAARFPAALRWLRRFAPTPQPRRCFGIEFPNPVGLAAGFDKNGVAIPAWAALGFGFVEIGTVTAQPQPGNPRPRIFRYPAERALINRLGFNNDGADVVAGRLQRLRDSDAWPSMPVGINIGKTRATPVERAADDYVYSFRRLHSLGDYVVLNVSSPNTPGLRDLQQAESLSLLLQAIAAENSGGRPTIVKVSPELTSTELDEVVDVCNSQSVSAIIATNTTLDHSAVAPAGDEQGGLSGAPLREKSTAIIRAIRSRSSIPVIGCGGIFNVADAREKIAAGAQLLQVYTGFIYRGPSLIREVAEGLAEKI